MAASTLGVRSQADIFTSRLLLGCGRVPGRLATGPSVAIGSGVVNDMRKKDSFLWPNSQTRDSFSRWPFFHFHGCGNFHPIAWPFGFYWVENPWDTTPPPEDLVNSSPDGRIEGRVGSLCVKGTLRYTGAADLGLRLLGMGPFLGFKKPQKWWRSPTRWWTALPVLDPRSLEILEEVTSSNFRAVDRWKMLDKRVQIQHETKKCPKPV